MLKTWVEPDEPPLWQLLADPQIRRMLRGRGVRAEQIWLLRQLALRQPADAGQSLPA